MNKVKLAYIGCGGIANWHLSHLINFEDVEFVGFCDIVIDRAKGFAEKTKMGQCFDNYIEMLNTVKPDCVYICIDPNHHGEIELELIKRKIPFLVEKPMALDMGMANNILDKITQANLITAVGFQDRYLDVVQTTKDWLVGKKIGLAYGAWVGGVPMVHWWRKYETSGGQIVEQNIHLFDGLRYIIGEPDRVYCAAGKGIVTGIDGYNVHDYSSAVVTFKNGVIANMFTGCYTGNGVGMQNGISIVADDVRIEYKLRESATLFTKDGDTVVKSTIDQGVTEDRTFIDAIKSGNGSAIRSPYSDAVKSLAFTLACNESLFTGKEIKVTY